MTPQTYARLMRLLPKLSALTDARRLKVLALIDRVLLADEDGATWCDIANMLMPPTIAGTQLAALVATIEGAAATVTLTEAACGFLAQLRERAAAYDDVYLSPRQREWLMQLHERACVVTDPPPAAEVGRAQFRCRRASAARSATPTRSASSTASSARTDRPQPL